MVPHGEVLTGFGHNFIAPKGKIPALIKLKRFLEDSKWQPQLMIIGKTPR